MTTEMTVTGALLDDIVKIGSWAWGNDIEWSFSTPAAMWRVIFGNKKNRIPPKMLRAVERVLHSRGGVDKETGKPLYTVDYKKLSQNPAMWIIPVKFAEGRNPDAVATWESSFEEALTAKGMDYNVRIAGRPLRIEVDKPNTPVALLRDYWQAISELPINQRISSPGVEYTPTGGAVMKKIKHSGGGFGSMVAAVSGAGKTQLCLSMVLSLAYTNSPEYMSLVVIDPKAMDTLPLRVLPHLARPIVTRPEDAVTVVQELVDEMDQRTIQAENGDNSFSKKLICLYIDELADLLAQIPAGKEQTKFIVNLQRLGQTGRARGFIFIFGTQRIAGIPNEIIANLNLKFVGKCRNAQDSVLATGQAGAQCHKLPGSGSFELWPMIERFQGYFIGDAESDNYAALLEPIINDIRVRWFATMAHWLKFEDESVEAVETQGQRYTNDDDGLLLAVSDIVRDTGNCTVSKVRNLWQRTHGKDLSLKRRNLVERLIREKMDAMDCPMDSSVD